MVTLESIKSYLRIDDNDSDDLLLTLCTAAKSQIRSSIDDFDAKYNNSECSDTPDFVNLADFCIIAETAELYDKRVGGDQAENFSFIVRNMLEILQYYSGADVVKRDG